MCDVILAPEGKTGYKDAGTDVTLASLSKFITGDAKAEGNSEVEPIAFLT